jgi:hypothetical protein
MAGITSFAGSIGIFTVNCFGQNAGAGCFTYPTRPTKKKSVRQLLIADGIFEGGGDVCLSHHRIKGLGPVLTG